MNREIIDESDVYIDVAKSIRRHAPAPRSRIPKGAVVIDSANNIGEGEENLIDMEGEQRPSHEALRRISNLEVNQTDDKKPTAAERTSSPKKSTIMRRTSSITGASDREGVPKRVDNPEMREHLKHLGPSNLASRPRQTRYNTVKIKPGGGSFAEVPKIQNSESAVQPKTTAAPQGGVGEGLLSSAGKDAKDGVLAVQSGYGSFEPTSHKLHSKPSTPNGAEKSSSSKRPRANSAASSQSTIASLDHHSRSKTPKGKLGGTTRSGSITENIVDKGGIRKVILETTSSSEDVEINVNGEGRVEDKKDGFTGKEEKTEKDDKEDNDGEGKGGKKKRRRKRKKGNGEDEPLIDEEGEE